MNKINRRRRHFINKDYQARFIARFVLVTTLWSAAAVLLFTLFAGKRLEQAMYSSHLSVSSASELLLPSASIVVGLSLLLSLLLAYAIHDLGKKISAPLYMLKKDLARVATGDLVSPVTLRPGDEFQELAADLDGMRKELGRRFSGLKEKHEALALAVAGLDRAVLQGLPLTGHIDGIGSAAAGLKEELYAFKR